MNGKEFLRFLYGMFMGTSVQYIKPTKRHMFDTLWEKIDETAFVQHGGSSNCFVLRKQDSALVINSGHSGPAEKLAGQLKSIGINRVEILVATSLFQDFVSGWEKLEPEQVLVGGYPDARLREYFGERCAPVLTSKLIEWGDEKVEITPLATGFSTHDLAVFLHRRKILVLGGMFYNRIHPVVHPGLGFDVDSWVRQLRSLLERFKPEQVLPAEGDWGKIPDVELFARYLTDLTDPGVEFQYCRKNYDWIEIPSYTSLEENFDLLREKKKSHTTLS